MLLPQDFGFTVLQEIQSNDIPLCLEVFAYIDTPVLMKCHHNGGRQEWEYSNEVGHMMVM